MISVIGVRYYKIEDMLMDINDQWLILWKITFEINNQMVVPPRTFGAIVTPA